MLEEQDWPDDMSGEQFAHFCMVTGFPVAFFRQGDPPELEISCCSSSYEDWLEEPLREDFGAGARRNRTERKRNDEKMVSIKVNNQIH
jgi:hypothetical protein